MFALFTLLPFVSDTVCKFNSTIPCFRNAALLLHTPHILCVLPPSCFLAVPAFGRRLPPWRRLLPGDALFLATLSSWRRLSFWATPSFLATPSLLPMPIAASNGEKIKTENQGKVFSQTCFSFIWVTSLKNPGRGERASP